MRRLDVGNNRGVREIFTVALPGSAAAAAGCYIDGPMMERKPSYPRVIIGGTMLAVVAVVLLFCIDEQRSFVPAGRTIDGDAAVVEPPRRSALPRMVLAVQSRSAEQVRQAFQDDPDVNEQDPSGRTALHRWAMTYSSPELTDGLQIFRMLVARGANVNATDDLRATPLHEAFRAGAVRLLVSANADVNAADLTGRSPLHRVAESALAEERVDAARILLEGGARVNATDGYGLTPLHVAAAAGDVDLARLLVRSGAGVNARDRKHRTPLARARLSFRDSMVEYLRSVGGTE